MPARSRRPRPVHHAEDFELDVLRGDDDLFKWFLLSYLFGKPIQSTVAAKTWRVFIDHQLDTPWAILKISEHSLVSRLRQGGYTRYQHVMARALRTCCQQLIDFYEGSLTLMIDSSLDQDELSKRLQKLYGVGPKTAEIFMRELDEFFARRVE